MIIHRKTFDDGTTLYHGTLVDDNTAAAIIEAGTHPELFHGITSPSRLRERATELIMLTEIAGSDDFQFGHTANGSPMLTIAGVKHNISVSHSKTELAIAIAGAATTAIGVDIENLRTQLLRVTSRFLNPAEIDFWTRTPERLLQAWSAKEAAFKAWSPQVNALSAITLAMRPDSSVTADAPFQHTLRIDFMMSQAPLRCIALARRIDN